MPEYETVAGTFAEGRVSCATCGHLVGLVDKFSILFFCRHCRQNVQIDLAVSKEERLEAMRAMLLLLSEMLTTL